MLMILLFIEPQPLGMESGIIGADQITSGNHWDIPNYFNLNSARLNSARLSGWQASYKMSNLQNAYSDPNNKRLSLRIDLGKKLKIIYIDVQQSFMADGKQNMNYFIYYGDKLSSMRPYTGVEANDYDDNFYSALV